jgi:quercetin dioxygenase-like cupin family protein
MEIIRKSAATKDELMGGIFKTNKVKSEALEVLELEIMPGSALKPHDMPCKVAFFVIEGVGTFTYGEKTETAKPGDMIHVDPGKPRFWANNSDAPLKVLVIKSLGEK